MACGSMSNYEQRLINDLRRSQGKVIGKLEARIDRLVRSQARVRADLKTLAGTVAKQHSLLMAVFADKDGGVSPPPPQ